MARQTITDYTFDPKAGTITLNGVSGLTLAQITSIRRGSEGIYFSRDSRNAKLVGNVLTLPGGSVNQSYSAEDELTITYETDPIATGSLGAAATDSASAVRLSNEIRSLLISKGIAKG